jgi:glycosyltransferase involved in cell wall biosynthesis
MICSRIIPKLDKDTKYFVMGKCPDSIKERFKSDNIVFLGFVDDIRSVVMSTDIYLCPMVYGTGIKTKIIEAMAMGIPVVTNSIGAEGLNVTNGKELYICDSDEEIIECTNTLLANDDLRRQMGDLAKNFVEEHHTWDKVYEAFGEMGL